jgi:5-methylcytosine-specific restriction protein A
MAVSNKRRSTPPFRGQRGRCSWCGTTDIPKGRLTWCSQKCVDEYLMRSSSEFIRRKVYERDKGICDLCGCDADAEYRAWTERRKSIAAMAERLINGNRFNVDWVDGRWAFRDTDHPGHREIEKFRKSLLDKYAPGKWTKGRASGWDADHIIPVAEGGGECDIDNFRTLCHPCHKKVTAALAKRLAELRRKS